MYKVIFNSGKVPGAKTYYTDIACHRPVLIITMWTIIHTLNKYRISSLLCLSETRYPENVETWDTRIKNTYLNL